MAAIFEAIKNFFSFIGQIITFVFKLFEDLIYTLGLLRNLVPKIPSYLNFLPAAVSAVFMTALTLIIIYKVIGRD